MSKKVVVFGASGRTGKYIIKHFQKIEGVEVSAFVRNPQKLDDLDLTNVNVITGDALVYEDVERAIQGQDVILTALEGDVLTMAKNIVKATSKTKVKRIIWMTGMGIHKEIKGVRGLMLGIYAKSRPEYIEAADRIAAGNVPYTLLRCPGIEDGDQTEYYLTQEGTQPRNKSICRAAIAKCMADMVDNEALRVNESLGITG